MKQTELNVVVQWLRMVHGQSLQELLRNALVLADGARHLAEVSPILEEPSNERGERYAPETTNRALRQTSTGERPESLRRSPGGNGQKGAPTW